MDNSAPSPTHPASPSLLSDLIRTRDVDRLAELLRDNGLFVDAETERRLIALANDRLLNDTAFAQVLISKSPDQLDYMLDQIEQTTRVELRSSRETSIDVLRAKHDLEASGLSALEIEELSDLLDAGLIDASDVDNAIGNGDIEQLRKEIERRINDYEHERSMRIGRTH